MANQIDIERDRAVADDRLRFTRTRRRDAEDFAELTARDPLQQNVLDLLAEHGAGNRRHQLSV